MSGCPASGNKAPDTPIEDAVRALFERDAVVNTISIMIRNKLKTDEDALCVVFTHCFNQDVSIGLDRDTVYPFVRNPQIRVPFSSLSRPQLQAITHALAHAKREDCCMTCTRMKTSFVLYNLSFSMRIDPRDVLYALDVILHRMQHGNVEAAQWRQIAPYIRRRLLASTVLPACVLLESQERLAREAAAREDAE